MRRQRTGDLADELTAECDAFLRGAYPAALARAHRPAPVWAWTSALAHGSAEDLHDLVRSRHVHARASGRWALACAYLAGEVLDLAERHGPLDRLQAELLIPLELELATRAEVHAWSPGPWVTAVTDALAAYERERAHR